MNKTEFVSEIAAQADVSKAVATRALDAMLDTITKALKKGDSVSFVGFGTFDRRRREARTGRNPRTGESIKIPAANVPSFRPGKSLKDSIQ